jgi:lipid-binding SYLF domain-containing protein
MNEPELWNHSGEAWNSVKGENSLTKKEESDMRNKSRRMNMASKQTKVIACLAETILLLTPAVKEATMLNIVRALQVILLLTLTFLPLRPALAASASEIDRNSTAALETLYETVPGAKTLGNKAKGILVFPDIVKAGFIIGGQYGDGALREKGKTVGYYRSLAASYGLQAGVQSFGYALFFMDDASLRYLRKSQGWEIGTGPSVVLLDKGFGKNLSSTTLQKGVYAFIFNQKGLMAGIGLQGSKITRITPDE